MREIAIVDTTLRDGLQAPHVALSAQDRRCIAARLIEIGITEIEVGNPATGTAERDLLQYLTQQYKKCRIIAWCRAKESDLIAARDCGAEAVHLSFPLSDLLLESINQPVNWIFEQLEALMSVARNNFGWVSIGAMDASRAPPIRLARFVHRAAQLGVVRIRIADTVGILTPVTTMQLINRLARTVDVGKLEFHGHNDLGMATANTISALEAGAGAASVTVNGIGERAGNAALEQVAVALWLGTELRSTIQLSRLQQLCEEVARYTHCSIPPDKPVTGAWTFTHQSGIHCHGIHHSHTSFEPYDPALTGHSPSAVVVGPQSGAATVLATMNGPHDSLTNSEARAVAAKARARALFLGRCLTPAEVAELARQGHTVSK
jgi:homocitrate synthase NifV